MSSRNENVTRKNAPEQVSHGANASTQNFKSDRPASAESQPIDDIVDEASQESFPASDPPAWTPLVGVGRRRPRSKSVA